MAEGGVPAVNEHVVGDGELEKVGTAGADPEAGGWAQKNLSEELSEMNVSEYSNISNPDHADQEPESGNELQSKSSGEAKDNVVKDASKEKLPQDAKKLRAHLSKSEKELNDLCGNMFSKLEDYLKGEVAGSVSDYALLEQMNRMTSYKYQHMLQVATSVGQSMHEINKKFSDLRPYLEQIEQIEENVMALEQAAYKLDSYAKRLEERFRKLEKK